MAKYNSTKKRIKARKKGRNSVFRLQLFNTFLLLGIAGWLTMDLWFLYILGLIK